MKRRLFVKSSVIAAAAGNVWLRTGGQELPATGSQSVREPVRDVPVEGEYEVIVAGGGPAGVAAAIASGRTGARTLLIEAHGCLGGIWTSGLLPWILDYDNKSGLMEELRNRLITMNAQSPVPTGSFAFSCSVESMKYLLESLCMEADVDILYHTHVVSAVKNESGRLNHVITESKSGRQAWKGTICIDATGDGDLAALAGCGYDIGNKDNEWQPMSLLGIVTGIHFDQVKSFIRYAGDKGFASKRRLLEQIRKGGFEPSYLKPGLYPISKDLYILMANHLYGYSGINAREVTRATLKARNELYQIVTALQSTGGDWKDIQLVATGEQIGIREARRIHGLYTITREDLIQGARFDDAVCRATFSVDVHSTNKDDEIQGKGYSRGIHTRPYDIPLRSLIAKDVGGLMMAGRCISGDFIAHSSYRVSGNAVIMGEAAGKVAATGARKNKLPQEVSPEEAGID